VARALTVKILAVVTATTAGGVADDAAQEAGASTPPSPSLVGTCHAYLVADKADHGKALGNPAFTALIAAAGGNGKVGPFCQTLVAASSPAGDEAKPSDKPDRSHPTSLPTDHLTRPSMGPNR
jgi:hypothetical protein